LFVGGRRMMERERIRDRMKREMDLRGFRPRTQHAYLRVCRKLVEYYGGELSRFAAAYATGGLSFAR